MIMKFSHMRNKLVIMENKLLEKKIDLEEGIQK